MKRTRPLRTPNTLQPGHYIFWQQRTYQVTALDSDNALLLHVQPLAEGPEITLSLLDLLAIPSTPGHKFVWSDSNFLFPLSQPWCKLAFQLPGRVGPFEGPGSLVIASNEVENGLLEIFEALEMIRLQEFFLQEREPNLQLIKP